MSVHIIRFIIALIALIVMLSLHGGQYPREEPKALPNAAFFFANYDDPMDMIDMVKSYAITMCVNDKVTGPTPDEWRNAGYKCYDSWASTEDDSSANDGGWREYQHPAYLQIVALCRSGYGMYPVCKYFK